MLKKLMLTLILGLIMAGPATPILKCVFGNGSPIGSSIGASAYAANDDSQGDSDDQGEDGDDDADGQ